MEWHEAFGRTFLERDIANLGFTAAPEALRRFWMMLAHYHGQTWNPMTEKITALPLREIHQIERKKFTLNFRNRFRIFKAK